MSAHASPHPGDIYAYAPENLAALRTAYVHQFMEGPPAYSWPDGWHRLVAEACAGLARLQPDGRWLEIKEKFAGLRLYHAGGPLRFDLNVGTRTFCGAVDPDGGPVQRTPLNVLIFSLEKASRETCCLCGGLHGIGREVKFTDRWLTSCEACEPLIRAHRDRPPEAAES